MKISNYLVFYAFMYRDRSILNKLSQYNNVFKKTDVYDFIFSDYYNREFGSPLYKELWVMNKYTNGFNDYELKIKSIEVEQHFLKNGKRQINIDPGLVSLSHIILFSTKFVSHRIPLNQGIYAEIELIYENGSYRPLKWTYPDFRTPFIIDFFNKLRKEMKCLR